MLMRRGTPDVAPIGGTAVEGGGGESPPTRGLQALTRDLKALTCYLGGGASGGDDGLAMLGGGTIALGGLSGGLAAQPKMASRCRTFIELQQVRDKRTLHRDPTHPV